MSENLIEAGSICKAGRRRSQRRFTRKERAQLLKQYASSGMSQKRFSQEHGVAMSTLTYWLRKSREAVIEGDAEAIVEISDQVLGGARLLVPALRGEPICAVVQVLLPNQVQLEVATGADAAWIAELARGLLTCSR